MPDGCNHSGVRTKKRKVEEKEIFGDAGDRTRGLSHAKRTRYHCATSPCLTYSTLLSQNTKILMCEGFIHLLEKVQ